MKLFNWFQRKSETFRAITMMLQLGRPIAQKTRYADLAREGYQMNSVVHACVKEIAEASAGVPWLLFQVDSKGGRRELPGHKLLALLQNPNPLQGRFSFIESVIAYQLNPRGSGCQMELQPAYLAEKPGSCSMRLIG